MFTKTKLLLGTIVIVALTSLVFATLSLPDRSEPKKGQYESVEYPASVQASINECGSIFYFEPDSKWFGTIPEAIHQDYADDNIPIQPTLVPVYGFMSRNPFDPEKVGVYDRTFEGFSRQDILRALWDGYNIMWYTPNISDVKYNQLKDYVENANRSSAKIILLPFNFPDKEIPIGRDIAFSSWNASQSCENFEPSVYDDFITFVKEMVPSRGVPPEAPLAPYGGLYPITPEYRP